MLRKDLKGLKEVKLKNSLTCILIPYTDKVSSVVMLYNAGSSDDKSGKTGTAHLLEHLMFNGTKHYAPFSYYIDSFGGYDNAFTDKDITVYHTVIPSNRLYDALLLEADRMVNLSFNGFKQEKSVIYEEYFMGENEEDDALWNELFAHLFLDNSYSHPVIGWESDIRNIELDDIKEFYDRFYTPENCILTIVSDIDADEILKFVEKTFGGISKTGTPNRRKYTSETYQRFTDIVLRKKNSGNRFIIGWRLPFKDIKFNMILNFFSRGLDLERSSPLWALVEDGYMELFNIRIYEYKIANVLAVIGECSPGKSPPVDRIVDIVENFQPNENLINRLKKMFISEIIISFDEAENIGINTALNYALFKELPNLNDLLNIINNINADDFQKIPEILKDSPKVSVRYA